MDIRELIKTLNLYPDNELRVYMFKRQDLPNPKTGSSIEKVCDETGIELDAFNFEIGFDIEYGLTFLMFRE